MRRKRFKRTSPSLSRLITVVLLSTTLFLLACSGGDATSAPTSTPTPRSEATPRPTPATGTELNVGMISTDLGVGTNRIVFFLLDSDSEPITVPEADILTFFPADATGGEPFGTAKSRFRQWPVGGLGVYTARTNFDRAGTWGLKVSVTEADGSVMSAQGAFPVKESSSTPAIGSPAPQSQNKTSRDVGSLEELTTSSTPDPDLYLITIADALASGKPLVAVFATPAFCESFTCGPQVEVLQEIKDRYRGRANFIHVEIFDNPHEIQGDLERARTAPAVAEWGLPSEPWTFIVDRQGLVAAKFEAFTTAEEIEEELERVLR